MKIKFKKKPRIFYPTNNIKIKNYGCVEFNKYLKKNKSEVISWLDKK